MHAWPGNPDAKKKRRGEKMSIRNVFCVSPNVSCRCRFVPAPAVRLRSFAQAKVGHSRFALPLPARARTGCSATIRRPSRAHHITSNLRLSHCLGWRQPCARGRLKAHSDLTSTPHSAAGPPNCTVTNANKMYVLIDLQYVCLHTADRRRVAVPAKTNTRTNTKTKG